MNEYPGRCDPDYQADHDGNRYPFHVQLPSLWQARHPLDTLD
jgi:hypothetical protein